MMVAVVLLDMKMKCVIRKDGSCCLVLLRGRRRAWIRAWRWVKDEAELRDESPRPVSVYMVVYLYVYMSGEKCQGRDRMEIEEE